MEINIPTARKEIIFKISTEWVQPLPILFLFQKEPSQDRSVCPYQILITSQWCPIAVLVEKPLTLV